jgi:hypothetical protein
LTPEQIGAFLAANHRSAESLLAASRASDDPVYLKEAKDRFPGDPRVQYAALFKSDSPEERRQWLDRLKQTAPDNALPDYLSALDDLKAGRTQQGAQELADGVGKAGFQDYMDQITQHKAAIKQIAQQNEKLLPNMPPEDLTSFLDREKLYGEPAAMQWYLNKSGQPAGTGSN